MLVERILILLPNGNSLDLCNDFIGTSIEMIYWVHTAFLSIVRPAIPTNLTIFLVNLHFLIS